jgi:hypothetical protein
VPDTDATVPHHVDGAGISPAPVSHRQASAYNLWSLGRAADAQRLEVVRLVRAVQPQWWRTCTDPPACQDAVTERPYHRLTNDSPAPTLCGLLAFSRDRPALSADRRRRLADVRVIIQIVIVQVTCSY